MLPICMSKKWKIEAMQSVQMAELRGFPMFSFLSNDDLVLDLLSINTFLPKCMLYAPGNKTVQTEFFPFLVAFPPRDLLLQKP